MYVLKLSGIQRNISTYWSGILAVNTKQICMKETLYYSHSALNWYFYKYEKYKFLPLKLIKIE